MNLKNYAKSLLHSISITGLIIFLFYSLSLLIVRIMPKILCNYYDRMIFPTTPYSILPQLTMYIIVLFLLCIFCKNKFSSFGLSIKRKSLFLFVLGSLLALIMYLVIVGTGILLKYRQVEDWFVVANTDYSFLTYFFLNLLKCIVIGITEEIVFRGICFHVLKKNFSNTPTVFIASILFTLYHIQSYSGLGLTSFADAFIGGMILGYLYLLTNSLYISIGFHAMYDFFLDFVASVHGSHSSIVSFSYINPKDNISTLIVLICTLLIVGYRYYHTRKKHLNDSYQTV